MPFFRYTATDTSGRTFDGTLESNDAQSASQALTARGFKSVLIHGSNSQSAQAPEYVRTKKASEFELMVFFSQAAQLIRAGIGPFDAFSQLSGRVQNPDLIRAANEISHGSREGGAISKTMAKYVDLFPFHTVGMVRAGEHGGFLPESLEFLANQYSEAASYRRWFWFLKFATWQGIVGVVLALPLPAAFWDSFRAGTAQALWTSYFKYLVFPTLPIVGGVAALLYLYRMRLMSSSNILKRHKLALKMPFGLGARGRAESLRAFLWSLRNLSHSGVAPSSAWAIAAGSVPNANIAMALSEAGVATGERPLSESFARARVFPVEYGPMFKTAEQTGDVVGTLDRLIQLSSAEFESKNSAIRGGLASAGCLIILLTTLVLVLVLVKGCYGDMPQTIEDWANSP